MAPTEIIQIPLTAAQPTTPPSSPSLPSSEHIATLANAVDIVKAVLPIQIASSPIQTSVMVEHLEQLISKIIEAKLPNSARKSEDAKPVALRDNQPTDVVAKVSRLEFKTVDELYVSNAVLIPSQLTCYFHPVETGRLMHIRW